MTEVKSNATLSEALSEARRRFADNRPVSRQAHERASQSFPGGNTRTVLYHGPFPIRVDRGEGAVIQDLDGHAYVNLLGEFTAGIFGHNHPAIKAAVEDALKTGLNLSAHTQAEVDFAEAVRARFPVMERLRFTNSGTEANLMAALTARHATGRSKVMVFRGGYHGSVFQFRDTKMPINAPFPYLIAEFNDTEGACEMIRANADDLACVLVEPMLGSGGCLPGDFEFLNMLRTETWNSGAVLIFDEVMTSRFGDSGAGALLGITPDVMTIGKWVGGGMSFGAFGGRADLMKVYDPASQGAIQHAGTFNNNAVTMHAGRAALETAFTAAAARQLHERGESLRLSLNAVFDRHDCALHASGSGSLMTVHMTRGPITKLDDLLRCNDAAKELFFLDLLERGFYIARRGFIAVSLAIGEDHLAGFLQAVEGIVGNRKAIFSAL